MIDTLETINLSILSFLNFLLNYPIQYCKRTWKKSFMIHPNLKKMIWHEQKTFNGDCIKRLDYYEIFL